LPLAKPSGTPLGRKACQAKYAPPAITPMITIRPSQVCIDLVIDVPAFANPCAVAARKLAFLRP